MSDIANGAGMTNIDVVSGSEAVFVGSYETGKIDIKDMNDIGTGEGVDKYSTFSHEMAEQRYKQSNPNSTSYTMAHNTAGIPAEEKVAGYKRADMPSTSPNHIYVKFSKYSTDYKTNKIVNVHIEINKNNVVKIERK